MKQRILRAALSLHCLLVASAPGRAHEGHSHDPAPAAADPRAVAPTLAHFYKARKGAPALTAGMTLDQAYQVQDALVAILARDFEARRTGAGQIAGYKAALTNPAVQEKFGVKTPLRGVLLAGMLVPSGSEVDAAFGSNPLHEGDLLLRVRSGAINLAKTRSELLDALDAVIPFIELPDLVYARDVVVDGPALAAADAGARLGVVGSPIPLAAGQDWERRLAEFKLEILDEQGQVQATGFGQHLLGHPLDAALWLRDAIVASGRELKRGDVLSLGTVTRLVPVVAGTQVRARYSGLDPRGPVEVLVKFVARPVEP
ncbi:MAG: hydratase [Candidatus Sericytochromatia bacterium]|nr:hydratase [Candidatus Tanganyikabacteria bacterium]